MTTQNSDREVLHNAPLQDVKRLDMAAKPRRISWWLRPVLWIASTPVTWYHRTRIKRVNMKGVRRPYLMLCNHNAFYDFMVAVRATFPNQAYYIVAIDGFLGMNGLLHWLMKRVGCIPKRKFTNDTRLVRQLREVADKGKIIAFYPEARYSLCGTNAILPPSLGKLVKMLKLPVVTLIANGHHVNSPFWHTGDRCVATDSTLEQILTSEQVAELSVDEINKIINEKFHYDDFAWQRDNKVKIKRKSRAEGLHKVLYQCPHCGKEYKMTSEGAQIWCKACGHRWEMDYYGQLHATEGKTYFSHIPDWYEWERENVRKEVEAGTYGIELTADVRSLPNPKRFIDVGQGKFVHNMKGFSVEGNYDGVDYHLSLPSKLRYSIHVEYNFRRWKRDCVDLSTLTDTFFVFPHGEDFSVTKMSLATEELYKHLTEKERGEAVATN